MRRDKNQCCLVKDEIEDCSTDAIRNHYISLAQSKLPVNSTHGKRQTGFYLKKKIKKILIYEKNSNYIYSKLILL